MDRVSGQDEMKKPSFKGSTITCTVKIESAKTRASLSWSIPVMLIMLRTFVMLCILVMLLFVGFFVIVLLVRLPDFPARSFVMLRAFNRTPSMTIARLRIHYSRSGISDQRFWMEPRCQSCCSHETQDKQRDNSNQNFFRHFFSPLSTDKSAGYG
jgi:hypothetical protein